MSKQAKVGDCLLIPGVVKEVFHSSCRVEFPGGECRWFKNENLHPQPDYHQGFEDGFNLAKEIAMSEQEGGMESVELERIFGTHDPDEIFKRNPAEVARDKIVAYRQGKTIDVDYFVEWNGMKCYVLDILDDDRCWLLTENGCVEVVAVEACTKLGEDVFVTKLLEELRCKEEEE